MYLDREENGLGWLPAIATKSRIPACSTPLKAIDGLQVESGVWRDSRGLVGVFNGGLGGTRTRDQRLKRPLLYRLSYQPTPRLTEALSALLDSGAVPR